MHVSIEKGSNKKSYLNDSPQNDYLKKLIIWQKIIIKQLLFVHDNSPHAHKKIINNLNFPKSIQNNHPSSTAGKLRVHLKWPFQHFQWSLNFVFAISKQKSNLKNISHKEHIDEALKLKIQKPSKCHDEESMCKVLNIFKNRNYSMMNFSSRKQLSIFIFCSILWAWRLQRNRILMGFFIG